MRIGQDFAFLKPEDNGGIDNNGNIIKYRRLEANKNDHI